MTTDRRHPYGIAPNPLGRNSKITVPDTVWLADISYIRTNEGWLYLAAVKDLASMEIVGLLSPMLRISCRAMCPCQSACKAPCVRML
jgi:transposase InsO family protein